MLPETAAPSPRALRRQRVERMAFGLNGGIFFILAWDDIDTHAPGWTVGVNVALGLAQLAALARSGRGSPVPPRVVYALAAIGMFASAVAVAHHRTGLPYAYALAGLLNGVLAAFGPEGLRRLFRKRSRDT